MKVFPDNSFNVDHLSELEKQLKEIENPNNIAFNNISLLFLKEKGPFGSLRTDAFVRKALAKARELNTGYSVIPVIDGNSPYSLREISQNDREALERRINYNGSWKPKLLELMQKQLNLADNGVYKAQEGDFIQLSRAEDRFYHLLIQNNENELGFPGAWVLYYSAEKGFWIQKIEPILIIPTCLICPYGMIENLLNGGYNMEQKQNEILQILNANGEKRRRNRPYDCPNPKCDFLFSHNEYGKIYRPNERAFTFPVELKEVDGRFSIILEETPSTEEYKGFKIAKIRGPLRSKK